jgi:DNA topoisomerase-3
VALAARKGIALPRGCKSSLARCRVFLDAEAGPAASRTAAPGADRGLRPPSAAMLRYARTLAAERGLDCPPEIETQFEACRRFLDAHAAPTGTGSSARQARPGPVKTTPGGAAGKGVGKGVGKESGKGAGNGAGKAAGRPRRRAAGRGTS